jgi:uncharacterized membrane protein YcaP (DUF421 family)
MEMMDAVFGSMGQVTIGQECARAVVLFLYGWIAVRLLGRRVFGKWAALDIIISMIIGSNLSRALTGSAPMTGTLVATTVLLLLHTLLAQGAARSRLLSRLVEGRPVRLVIDGNADAPSMRRWSISQADLEEAMRRGGFTRASDVREGVLEPSGRINLLD